MIRRLRTKLGNWLFIKARNDRSWLFKVAAFVSPNKRRK